MSLHAQEDFVIERFKELETDLDKKAQKPYDEFAKAMALILMRVFKKYETLSVSIKFILIKQELERLKVFEQIKTHYGQQGLKFVDFLKGVLDTNFVKAVEHTNQMLGNEENVTPDYVEPTSVEAWKYEATKQGAEMIALITLLVSQGKEVEEIVQQVTQLSEGQSYKAKRLARTETAQLLNATALAIMSESGVKQVKWTDATETLLFRDKTGKKHITRVCPRCKAYANGGKNLDGVYPIGKLPSPIPAHPNCRCTLIPIK